MKQMTQLHQILILSVCLPSFLSVCLCFSFSLLVSLYLLFHRYMFTVENKYELNEIIIHQLLFLSACLSSFMSVCLCFSFPLLVSLYLLFHRYLFTVENKYETNETITSAFVNKEIDLLPPQR